MIRGLLAFALTILVACVGPFSLASAADAQPAAPRRIGVLFGSLSPQNEQAKAFREGLADAGYVEGRDVTIEWRYANGDYARAEKLAADLVQRKVNVIVVQGTLATLAVKRATSTIPVVMASVAVPSRIGPGYEPRTAWRKRHRALAHAA